MQRLRVIQEPNGAVRFADAETNRPWGMSPPGTIEAGVQHATTTTTPRIVLRSSKPIGDAESVFASWSAAGWDAFEDRLHQATAAANTAHPGTPVLVWPGPGSVLSDGVSTLSFARKHPSIGLVIDPVSWITDAMRPDAEDHLRRFGQALALCESLEAVIVRGAGTPGAPEALDADSVAALLAPAIERAGVAGFV